MISKEWPLLSGALQKGHSCEHAAQTRYQIRTSLSWNWCGPILLCSQEDFLRGPSKVMGHMTKFWVNHLAIFSNMKSTPRPQFTRKCVPALEIQGLSWSYVAPASTQQSYDAHGRCSHCAFWRETVSDFCTLTQLPNADWCYRHAFFIWSFWAAITARFWNVENMQL